MIFVREKNIAQIVRGGLIAAFFLPLIIVPGFLYPHHFGKVILFQALVEFLLVIVLLFSPALRLRVLTAARSPVAIAYIVFIGFRLVTGFIGENPEKSFWGDQMRMTGTFTFLHFYIFFLLLAAFFDDERGRRRLNRLVVATGFIAVLLGFFQRYTESGGRVFGISEWFYGAFGNPSFLAGYLLPSLFLVPAVVKDESNKWRKVFWGAMVLPIVSALFLAQARSALVGVFFGAVIFGAVYALTRAEKKKKTVLAVAALAGAALLITVTLYGAFRGGKFEQGGFFSTVFRQATVKTRLLNWGIALKGIKERPLFGWGPENYEIVFDRFYNPELLQHSFAETWSERPHNLFLEIAVGSGFIGLASYVAIFAIIIFRAIAAMRDGKMGRADGLSLVGALTALSVHNIFLFDTFGTLLVFSFLLAFGNTFLMSKGTPTLLLGRPHLSPMFCVIARYALLAVIPTAFYFGNLQPLWSSHFADKLERDWMRRDYVSFKESFAKSLRYGGVFHDEIRKMLSDDVIKGDASGRLPGEITQAVLPYIVVAMRETVQKHPYLFSEVYRLGQLLTIAGIFGDKAAFDEAEFMLLRAKKLSPGRQVAEMAHAQLALAEEDLEKAAVLSEKFFRENPKLPLAHWIFALVLASKGETERAMNQFDEIFKNRETAAITTEQLFFIIDFYAQHGALEKIPSVYEILIAAYPKRADLRARLAATYAVLGMKDKARSAVMDAMALDPSYKEEAEEFLKTLK